MADLSSWTRHRLSGTSAVNVMDDVINSFSSEVEAAIQEEHYLADSAASGGEHKLGSARVYVGSASQLSNPRIGRVMWLTDEYDFAVASNSSYSKLGAVRAGSVNTFTALQHFSSGVSASGVTANAGRVSAATVKATSQLSSPEAKVDQVYASGMSASVLTLAGTAYQGYLKAAFSWNPGTIGAGSSVTTGITVTGAALGDAVAAALPWNADRNESLCFAYVGAANQVVVGIHNNTGGNLILSNRSSSVVVIKA